MKLLKGILSITIAVGFTLAITSCCHWKKNCSTKPNSAGMCAAQASGMDANLLHRPPLAQPPTNFCCDELIADGSFEYDSSGIAFGIGANNSNIQQGHVDLHNQLNGPVIGPWEIEQTDQGHTGEIGFASNQNALCPNTSCGNLFVFLGMSAGNVLPPYTASVMSEQIYTKLKEGSHYHLCFLQSALATNSVSGEVKIELYKSFPPNALAFSGDWTVGSGTNWTMQTSNILIRADDFYTIKISSVTNKVAIIDGVSLRGPY